MKTLTRHARSRRKGNALLKTCGKCGGMYSVHSKWCPSCYDDNGQWRGWQLMTADAPPVYEKPQIWRAINRATLPGTREALMVWIVEKNIDREVWLGVLGVCRDYNEWQRRLFDRDRASQIFAEKVLESITPGVRFVDVTVQL